MHPGSEPLGAIPSFSARRPNASSLPNFELPPPPLSQFKLNSYGGFTSSQPTPATVSTSSVGNLLTPPSNVPGDGLSPISTGVQSTNSSSTQAIPPYGGYWTSPQQTGSSPYSNFSSAPAQHQPHQYGSQARGSFTPESDHVSGLHHSQSYQGLPPPPHELNNLPPFPSSGSMSAPATLPTMPAQHAPTMMGSQTPVSSAAPYQSPVHAQEQFQPRQPPTPTYYQQQSQAPQHSPYPYSTGPSPTQHSPLSSSASMPRMSPSHSASHVPTLHAPAHSPQQFQRPFPPQYPLPGPVLSNVGNPHGNLALVGMPHMMGPFNSGHAAQWGNMHGGHPQQQPPTNDRPFKCDQCPQSFNRNHDLKRHKRIHLAVKPFPCGHCDKSFSRKDALKRHILVKGCGKAQSSAEGKEDDNEHSPKAHSVGADSLDGKH